MVWHFSPKPYMMGMVWHFSPKPYMMGYGVALQP